MIEIVGSETRRSRNSESKQAVVFDSIIIATLLSCIEFLKEEMEFYWIPL